MTPCFHCFYFLVLVWSSQGRDIDTCGMTNSQSTAGTDHMSWTRAGYPSAFAAEADPNAGGFPGDFERYIHTTGDRMDIDDETGVFSLEVCA